MDMLLLSLYHHSNDIYYNLYRYVYIKQIIHIYTHNRALSKVQENMFIFAHICSPIQPIPNSSSHVQSSYVLTFIIFYFPFGLFYVYFLCSYNISSFFFFHYVPLVTWNKYLMNAILSFFLVLLLLCLATSKVSTAKNNDNPKSLNEFQFQFAVVLVFSFLLMENYFLSLCNKK